MPQLRDSGNHSTAPLDAHTKDEIQSFARIFGIETEYGVSVTGSDRPCDAGQTAMMMFQPIVAEARSTNTYIENGSRLYLDVGSHPEYATAEARDPMDALALDAAGELVMRDLALDAQRRLRSIQGAGSTVHVFKNNVDSAGHSFGCHENYLVRRFVPLKTIEQEVWGSRASRSRSVPISSMRRSHRPPRARVRWSTRATNRMPILTRSDGCM